VVLDGTPSGKGAARFGGGGRKSSSRSPVAAPWPRRRFLGQRDVFSFHQKPIDAGAPRLCIALTSTFWPFGGRATRSRAAVGLAHLGKFLHICFLPGWAVPTDKFFPRGTFICFWDCSQRFFWRVYRASSRDAVPHGLADGGSARGKRGAVPQSSGDSMVNGRGGTKPSPRPAFWAVVGVRRRLVLGVDGGPP